MRSRCNTALLFLTSLTLTGALGHAGHAAAQDTPTTAAEAEAAATEAGPAAQEAILPESQPARVSMPEPSPNSSAAPEPQPAVADASADEEAARLLAEVSGDAAAYDVEQGPTLDLYGFVDFRLAAFLRNDVKYAEALYGGDPSFAVGNVNLYAASNLGSGFRSLIELRFLYLPNGSLDSTSGSRQTTTTLDYTDGSRPIRWSGLLIERAWLEYSAHALINIRVGQWLTPVGIWNVDHGTPTIIPALRPYAVSEGIFPLRQTGIELFGNQLLGDVTLGYHLTLSNGRGNIEEYQDLDANKGLGLRVYASFDPLGALTLGASGYMGRATYGDVSVAFAAGSPSLNETLIEQYDEVGFAADLLWLYEGLHLQAEVLTQEVAYTDAGRPSPDIPVPGGGFVPDHRRFGTYALVGYRFSWLTVMPYAMIQYMDYGLDAITAPGSIGSGQLWLYTGGLNFRPTAQVTLKAQVTRVVAQDASGIKGKPIVDQLATVVAWSF